MPSFSASNSSPIFCRPSKPVPLYRTAGAAWIFTLSEDSFSLTTTTSLSTIHAAVIMLSRYRRAISAVTFWGMIAVIMPLSFLLAFMIQMWAGACTLKSPLLIADASSWSISLGNYRFLCLLSITGRSAKLELLVGAGAGMSCFFRFCGGIVSHHLVGIGTDVITGFGVNVVLGVRVGVSAGFGLCFGFNLSSPPFRSCWHSLGNFGPAVSVKSACIEDSRPTPLVSAVLSSPWLCSVPPIAPLTISVMSLPHTTSSWWYTSHSFSISSNHVFIPRHNASCTPVCVSSKLAILAIGSV